MSFSVSFRSVNWKRNIYSAKAITWYIYWYILGFYLIVILILNSDAAKLMFYEIQTIYSFRFFYSLTIYYNYISDQTQLPLLAIGKNLVASVRDRFFLSSSLRDFEVHPKFIGDLLPTILQQTWKNLTSSCTCSRNCDLSVRPLLNWLQAWAIWISFFQHCPFSIAYSMASHFLRGQ